MSAEEIARLDALFTDNLDCIPVANWGFSNDVFEYLRKEKHTDTNKILTAEERSALSNQCKQRIARRIGSTYQLVSDILHHIRNTRLADIVPKKPKLLGLQKKIVAEPLAEVQGMAVVEDQPKKKHKDKASKGKKPKKSKAEKKALKIKENNRKAQKTPKITVDETTIKKAIEKLTNQPEERIQFAGVKRNASTLENGSDLVGDAKRPKISSNLSLNPSDTQKSMTKKDKRDEFRGRDYGRLLMKAEKRQQKLQAIREYNPDKAHAIENNIEWQRVMKRAAGDKVKDNVDLLKKGMKMKQKRKERTKRKWSERVQNVEEKKRLRQEKRQGNIRKRRDAKIQKKQKKRLIKGT